MSEIQNRHMADNAPRWYVVHTYSGYENKVKANLEKIIENRGMQEQILEVSVPMQNVVEIKNGVRKTVNRKVFPGYVLVFMFMNDETWYVVRNTRGVTSFVGPGSKPVPLSDEEIHNMGLIESETEYIDFAEGDLVRITTGPFEDSMGLIAEINQNRRVVIVTLTIFGRETPVELDYFQIEKVK
ncbi:MAG: transcription termination/antitermination protein NusG [Clostridiales bacterium]|jgi:transcriptional antiterminator NusG|nr:transcription termination/antitermination protein NusG [Clostridiales bacterium]